MTPTRTQTRNRAWLLALLVCGSAIAADPGAQVPGSTASPVFDMFKVLLGLVVVLGAMAGVLWLMKRTGLGPAQGGGAIKVVGGVSVGNRERVLVLEVAGQWIVVGVAPGSVNALANLPRQEQFA
ncbi:MAG: flagellar biosynthetic protein FliO, partial [Burkholderiaceae bacterium]|nr:flagellar biosynthetic protein FliO [Burkholderiaceae bacterium]